ncbi:MAG: cytochrome c [Flavobacteriales bacterium]|nr:cytochrome c [Flavobacteriales bacterium]NNK80056.1 cytochrome c [Flavobacteriales bacterium]
MRRNTEIMESKVFNKIKSSILVGASVVLLISCNNDPLSPGIEYMPDMYRSPAIEEYVDYGEMRDRINVDVSERISALEPVEGTIAYSGSPGKAHFSFPYAYENTVEDYELAGAELVNPVVFTEEVYINAKANYEIFCIHCHGEKGAGNGILIENGKFAAPPAYQGIAGLTQGKMFHTLHYGKGNMGSHAGQLNREERWELVHYVQTLVDEQYDNPFKAGAKAPASSDNPVTEETN